MSPDDRAEEAREVLHIALDTWEGPLDLLLALARAKRVDLREIPILPLVDQYLAFIANARALRLELAADYLVMAAWLAYLKSALLLPEPRDPEVDPEAMAERLRWRLARLAAMRDAAAALLARERLGRDVFARGSPEGLRRITAARVDVGLYDLLAAYGAISARRTTSWTPARRTFMLSIEEALERLSRLVGETPDWTELLAFLPKSEDQSLRTPALAASFAAILELVRAGQAEISQAGLFQPLMVRSRASQA